MRSYRKGTHKRRTGGPFPTAHAPTAVLRRLARYPERVVGHFEDTCRRDACTTTAERDAKALVVVRPSRLHGVEPQRGDMFGIKIPRYPERA